MATFENQFKNGHPRNVGHVDMPSTPDKNESGTQVWLIIPRTFWRMIKYNLRFNKRAVSLLFLVFIFCGVVWWINESDYGYKNAVDVFIVEENHEVLKYWYAEANAGTIRKSGNTLIHIDAHSDMAPPLLTKHYPFFSWPKNQIELFELMQDNSVFISGAASAGLIDNFVWIYPPSDASLPQEKHFFQWGIGYFAKSNKICECMTPYDVEGAIMEDKTICAYLDTEGQIDIDKKSCDIKRSISTTHLPANLALSELEQGTLVPKTKHILLDIDECFFGWERGLQILEDAGISSTDSKNIHARVKKMFCPQHVKYEHHIDKLIKNYIIGVIKTCDLSTPEKACQKDRKQLEKMLDPIIENAYKKEPFTFCGKGLTQNMRYAHDILGIFRSMNSHQLEAIMELGFCMKSSSAITDFDPFMNNFGLCFGSHVWNATDVGPKTTYDEYSKKFGEFFSMMEIILDLEVRLISVVRSVRDGLTPRDMASDIEGAILSHLRQISALGDVDYLVNYDRNLLGGKMGWEGRYMNRHKSHRKQKA